MEFIQLSIWNIPPAGFECPQAQDSKRSLMTLVLKLPSLWWQWHCCAVQEDPQSSYEKLPQLVLPHGVIPSQVPLDFAILASLWGASEYQPCLQPIINHSSSLASSREGSGFLYLLPIHPSRHFKRKKTPTSASCCLFLNPEWSHTRGIITKWDKKICVTETDYCETALRKLRKMNWRGKLPVFLCFKHTQTM